jgi:CheY-like chemotaxis protein/HPt (histidine-containing phosphotransfer) domain-containing protein
MTSSTNNSQASAAVPARILVAEDSPLNRQVALAQLAKLGYQADSVADGAGVLEATQRVAYDIVLMDCQMPEANGYEATWQIRERERELSRQESPPRRVYIIAMTASTNADERAKCLEAGMDDYIHKPVELPALEAALHRGLADRASQKALEEVIDPVVIAGLHQLTIPGKPEPLAALIDLFLEEAPTQIQSLEAAVAENDASSLARVFRATASLKGSASNLGARNLAALCDEIEQTARNWSLADVPALLDRTRQELVRVREALEKIKRRGETQPRGTKG